MLRWVPVPCGPVAWTAPVLGFTSRFGSPYTWIGSTIRGTPKLTGEVLAPLGWASEASPPARTRHGTARATERRTKLGLSNGACDWVGLSGWFAERAPSP